MQGRNRAKMAVKTFDEIYSTLSADEKKVLDNVFAKEPDLKGGWTRQDDYSRKTQELATERKKFETELEYATRMKAWAEDAVPKYDALVEKGLIDDEGNELWSAQKTELEKQLEEAKRAAAAGGDMDPKELERVVKGIVKDAGVQLSQDELKALIANEGRKLAKEEFATEWAAKETDFNTKTIPMVSGFSAAEAVMAVRYEKETGEPWTREKHIEMIDLMGKEQKFDPFEVVDKMMGPARDKKVREAEIQAEVEKRVKAMPGGGDLEGRYIPGPDAPKGSLQAALDRDGGTNDFEATIKAMSVEAAKELVAEGKA